MRAPVAADATFSPTGGPAPHPTRSDAPQARTEARLTEDERLTLIDRLPVDMNIWADDDELDVFTGRDRTWWADALGHPAAHRGCCRTCGCATTCLHDAYHEALVATVIRELNKLGALRLPEETDRA